MPSSPCLPPLACAQSTSTSQGARASSSHLTRRRNSRTNLTSSHSTRMRVRGMREDPLASPLTMLTPLITLCLTANAPFVPVPFGVRRQLSPPLGAQNVATLAARAGQASAARLLLSSQPIGSSFTSAQTRRLAAAASSSLLRRQSARPRPGNSSPAGSKRTGRRGRLASRAVAASRPRTRRRRRRRRRRTASRRRRRKRTPTFLRAAWL